MTVAYGKLPFDEQLRFFRNKLNIPTESYADIYGAEHDHAFVVAGANRLDLLADFRTAVDKAIADGTTLEEFRRDFDAIVAKYGWDYISSTSVSSLLSNPQARGMLNREVAAMVDKLVQDGVSRGASLSVGAIAPGIIKALDQRGLTPSTSVITLRDQDVLHALRPGKHQPLPVQFWRDFADHLMTPERVLLMKNENPPVLLYVYDLGGDKGKIALKMDYDLAVKTPQGKRKVKGNIVRTGSMLLTQAEINSLKGEIAIWQK